MTHCLLLEARLGSAVTSTAESIMTVFVKSGSKWKIRKLQYTNLPVEFKSETVYFVYGWFGLYNDDPCSVKGVVLHCHHIANAFKYKSKKHAKFIIGLSVDLDTLNKTLDKQYEDHYDKMIKAPCENSGCKCKSLKIGMFKREESKIGIPLKLMSDEKLYQIIMYVCLKGELRRSDEVDRELVKNLHYQYVISKTNIDVKMEALEKYIRMRKSEKRYAVAPEKATYIFWHPFIYICAFHALFEFNPDGVMTYCNIDAILQLVRPEREDLHREDYLTIAATEEKVKLFKSRLNLMSLSFLLPTHH
ncbi:uncharacterized protein LOC144621644 [Crassostrea virginica]